MCWFAPRLCGVHEQNSGGVPARNPDRLIKWFIGVVVIGVGVNLLSSWVVAQKWAWLPPAVFVAALLVAVPTSGLLRRERYSTTRARAMALLALTGYLAVTVWGSVTGWPLALMILSLAYLCEAGVMLMWSTLRSRADPDHVALGTACLLVGSAFVLLGVANPPDAWTLSMVAGLVDRVAFLLLGVAALLDRWQLVGVPFLLFGVGALLGSVAALLDGWTLVGVALLLAPVTALLLGVAFLLDRWALAGIPFLVGAVAAPLSGIAALLAGWTLMGVAFLLFGLAALVGGVAAFLAGWTLVGVPFLLFGVAAMLSSVAALLAGWTLVGGAFLLLGVAALLGGVTLLYRPQLPQRLVVWLTKRDDMPLTADGNERD